MGELGGRTVLVTGANSGVGFSATRLLAEAGARVIMVCRNEERGNKALHDLQKAVPDARLALELADMSSLSSVRSLATRIGSEYPEIDTLINNAGVFRARREMTADGFERTLATNHLGHFLLTMRLLDRIRNRQGLVINVSSEGHRRGDLRRAPLEDIIRGKTRYRGVQAYGDSKLANVLFAFELARRYQGDGVTACALHPGVLATRIWNQNNSPLSLFVRMFKPFMGKPDEGGKAALRLVVHADPVAITGHYFDGEEQVRASYQAFDEPLAAELWDLSERLVGV
jgi:NAD(P)-dependent dehydrogenase (short-subunit alcohol dehydrogenase family)